MISEKQIEAYMWPALAWIGALSLIVYIGIWTTNNQAFKLRCLEVEGSYLAGSGTCHIKKQTLNHL